MAVKKKNQNGKPVHEQIVEGIGQAVRELYTHHSGEIQENLDESEAKKVKVTFGCELDLSESEPLVTVGIRFSASVTDKRVFKLDDPNQIKLFPDRASASPEPEEQPELAGAPNGE